MSRKSKLYNTRSIGFRFNLQCFVRDSNNIASSNKTFYCRCFFAIAIIVIYLQYQYILDTVWTKNMPKDLIRTQVNRYYTYQYQRVMSYERFKAMKLALKNVDRSEMPRYQKNTPICFLNKSTLLGRIRVETSYISPRKVERLRLGVMSGGFYAPSHCRAKHKVAILVPFRNRTTNLSKFLRHMHPFLQKQLLQYRIFVIEQIGREKFNKGALYNIAFLETQRFGTWNCLVFQDVDLLPQDGRILYSCLRKPAHMCPALDCWQYQFSAIKSFGGVTSMTPEMYLQVNGYSNAYWNWGAEDDDMFVRIKASKLGVWRYNMTIARFHCLPHPKNEYNPKRYILLGNAKRRYKTDGLKSLQYKLIAIIKRKLFTHILVDVNPFNYTV
ncbi:hypothetical protein ABMA27_004826 [Loxostege sticticalis]|uniref:Beta-1,4-N-acetylgalactosaminyltransferase n=1 Tax=Loxostege sticticalis TaxID=481309 RepID=A0ABR3HKR2_LOXSC